MKPKEPDNTPDLFRAQLSQILNLQHPLCRLAGQIDWEVFDHAYGELYADGPGRPGLPTRLMVGVHYLMYRPPKASDESVLARWLENPYWQYFCGYEYLQHELPLHPTSLVKWRQRIGAERLELLLAETVATARRGGALKPSTLARVNVDTTVVDKAVAFPTDARQYHKMRVALVCQAQRTGMELRQSYRRLGKRALARQGRYAHARQMRRAQRETRRLKTYLGRVVRDIRCKCPAPDERLQSLLERADQLLAQQRHSTNKLYSVHAPEVVCIAKGKAHKRYEFGAKASVATTSRENWIVAAAALAGNPYDGHTLGAALAQVERLSGVVPRSAFCDQGYRGHGYEGPTRIHVVGRIPKRASRALRRWLKRRAAIEPSIGHLKADHRLNRNPLRGEAGDRTHVVLAAAGYNLAKLLALLLFVWNKLCQRAWFRVKGPIGLTRHLSRRGQFLLPSSHSHLSSPGCLSEPSL